MAGMNEFRRGMFVLMDSDVWKIVDLQHVNPGNKRAFVRTTFKNVSDGRVIEKVIRGDEDLPEVLPETRDMQLLYRDSDGFHFMDTTTFDQVTLPAEAIGDAAGYVKDEETIRVDFHQGRPIGVELPTSVVLRITETEPGVKGDSVSNVMKPARLETGLQVKVPLFVGPGESVKIDTRTGEYLGRA